MSVPYSWGKDPDMTPGWVHGIDTRPAISRTPSRPRSLPRRFLLLGPIKCFDRHDDGNMETSIKRTKKRLATPIMTLGTGACLSHGQNAKPETRHRKALEPFECLVAVIPRVSLMKIGRRLVERSLVPGQHLRSEDCQTPPYCYCCPLVMLQLC